MSRSKAGWQLRRALKARTQRSRRRAVVAVYVEMAICLLLAMAMGGKLHDFRRIVPAACTVLIACTAGQSWYRSQRRIVGGLDDWAQLERGLNFDELPEAEQIDLIGRHRLGSTRLLDAEWNPEDEGRKASRMRANATALRIIRPALLCIAVGYGWLYLVLPAGYLRGALTDGPLIFAALVAFIVPLPRAIEMWTEPDAQLSFSMR